MLRTAEPFYGTTAGSSGLSRLIKNTVFYQNNDDNEVTEINDIRWDLNATYPVDVWYSVFSTEQVDQWSAGNDNLQTNAPGLTADGHIFSTASPCYQSGDPNQNPNIFIVKNSNGVPLDLDGYPRFYNTRIDRGVYELQQ